MGMGDFNKVALGGPVECESLKRGRRLLLVLLSTTAGGVPYRHLLSSCHRHMPKAIVAAWRRPHMHHTAARFLLQLEGIQHFRAVPPFSTDSISRALPQRTRWYANQL